MNAKAKHAAEPGGSQQGELYSPCPEVQLSGIKYNFNQQCSKDSFLEEASGQLLHIVDSNKCKSLNIYV